MITALALALLMAPIENDRAAMARDMDLPTDVADQLFARKVPAEKAKDYVAASAPDPFIGAIEMTVRSARRLDDRIYLNSERDYRDGLNVSVVIDKSAMRKLDKRLGGPAEIVLLDQRIVVAGMVAFVRAGREGQYTRTQMSVVSPYQIEMAE